MNALRVIWIDVGQGVRLGLLPVTPAMLTVARRASVEAMQNARRAGKLKGMSQEECDAVMLVARWAAVAEASVIAWEGVVDAAGEPVPCTPGAVRRLIENHHEVTARFLQAATRMAEGGPSHG